VPEAVVVGAGVFGVSLAHRLALRDWDVTLVDRYPPGHVRAASGGESRLIRYAHGADGWYTRSAWRARELWRQIQAEVGAELLVPAGVAWFARRTSGWELESERTLHSEGIPAVHLPPDDAHTLFPDVTTHDLAFLLWEPEAGILRARDAVRAVFRLALAAGVRFAPGGARPVEGDVAVDGMRLSGDVVVWACGGWLPGVFPFVPIRVTKQDVFFFGAPLSWETPAVPGWVDYDGAAYGLGDLDGRGLKLAPDAEGERFDPEGGPRTPSAVSTDAARSYLAHRFPALADAPLVGTRTCQYALTPDTNFLFDRHPELEQVWLLGGGSGHGFKHGPSFAEYAADVLEGAREPEARFAIGPRAASASFRTAGSLR
jgi:glycine/D-amino acid oxidase-like deaminating enzyme